MGESEFFAQRSTSYHFSGGAAAPRRLGELIAAAPPISAASQERHISGTILDDARSRLAFGGMLIFVTTFYAVTVI